MRKTENVCAGQTKRTARRVIFNMQTEPGGCPTGRGGAEMKFIDLPILGEYQAIDAETKQLLCNEPDVPPDIAFMEVIGIYNNADGVLTIELR